MGWGQVVTCVKLKYVQQPVGRTAGTSAIIRPSKRIIYDTTEAVVSFLSEDVDTCVDEFLEEWARVSKMVVIAREGAYLTHSNGILIIDNDRARGDCSGSNEQKIQVERRPAAFVRFADCRVCVCCCERFSTR